MVTVGRREELIAALGELIREASRNERLASLEELRAALEGSGLPDERLPDGLDDPAGLLAEALAVDPGLAEVRGPGGEAYYHAPAFLSRTYAAILAGKSSPCLLMASVIRSNSADYPRPVPLDMFEYPPFNLEPEVLSACLKTMAEKPDFEDISFTTSSVGTVYLFSTRHLDRQYAAFLAERADVGLASNP